MHINTNKKITRIDQAKMQKAANVLRVLDHEIRQDILNYLLLNPYKCNQDLQTAFQMEQAFMSQHLAELKSIGVISFELSKNGSGKFHYYYAIPEKVEKINKALKKFFRKSRK